ncbi:AraC family transcriptional regulator [Paractinoplanes hotanensis]|uniref:AraC family transcriptional regulator n=1 Tax=Paractinoplanes hotanensis TaxID=2906497 RepID=A0ABT0Y521_9ACTN|nr:AraC family transcriptional regulator [Actinoplanes hotanensis]MCM4081129.1 AraC family transcriptional regulator [Actinoplanes hotanensis]
MSQAIAALRVGRGTVRRFRQSGTWGLSYTGLTGSGFHLVLHGTGWLLPEAGPAIELSAGDVVLITSGADHGLASEPRPLRGLAPVELGDLEPDPAPADFEFLCGAYRLPPGLGVHPYLTVLPDPIVVRPLHGDDSVAALLDRQQSAGLVVEATRHALLDLVLADALRRWLATAEWPATRDPKVTAAISAIDASPDTRWTVQDLSRAAGMSRATFTRRFTSAVGHPPASYLLAHRLRRAALLLRETDAPVAAIARRTGYLTEAALAHAFRREFGIAPGAFRRAQRGADAEPAKELM